MTDNTQSRQQLLQELADARQRIAVLEAAQQAIKEEAAKASAILEVLPDLMFRLSAEGIHLEYFAPRVDQLFVHPEVFLGKTVEEVLPRVVALRYKAYIQLTLEARQKQVFEYYLDFADQGRLYYEATMVKASEDAVIVLVHNITERKQVEYELSKSEEILVLKDRIISTVSHEFRTPLAVIQTAYELLTHYSDRLTNERKHSLFQQINRQVKMLTELVDDILSVSRAQSGKTEFTPALIDLEAFCQTVFDQIRFMDHSGRQFKFTSHMTNKNAMVDSKLLHRILTNLLTNAVKYSPEGSGVSLDLDQDEHTILIKISDEGIGIPEMDQPLLFDAFHRASNVGDRLGTGIGLTIVKEYVTLHGGRITVESQVGKGSTFTISLPSV